MMKSKTLFQSEVEAIKSSNKTNSELAQIYNVSKWTISRVKRGLIEGMEENFDDSSLKLSMSLQKQRETANRERKLSRETIRIADVIQSSHNAFIDVLKESKIVEIKTVKHKAHGKSVGIIQLSDLHFGERVIEVSGNEFDLEVASKRLRKLAAMAISEFWHKDVDHVVIAMTGDLINSDRRFDELVANVNNRAKVVFSAVEILKQFIMDINQYFNVTIASVCGNESRINKDLGWVDFMAFDSFDAVIHYFLTFIFQDKEGVEVLPMIDPLEKVIDVNGHNICMIHGHNGIASDSAMENKVARLTQKYQAQGVKIDYTIFGHVHCHKEDIEVLTKHGFVKLKDVSVGDEVYGYEDGRIVLTKVNDVVLKEYTGKMYKFNNRKFHHFVTEDHNFYLKNGDYITANKFIEDNRIKDIVTLANPLEYNQEYGDVTDDELRLIVAIAADGSFSHGKYIRFHLKKERKKERLKQLFKKIDVDLKFGAMSARNTQKTLAIDLQVCDRFVKLMNGKKELPDWFKYLSTRQTKVVVEELEFWDGSYNSLVYSKQYASNKPNEIDIVQLMVTKLGILSTSRKSRNIVGFSLNGKENKFRDRTVRYEVVDVVNEKVGCLSTGTKNFFVRNNGAIELTGNCTRISDLYARSASLVGGNAYSDKALTFTSRAAQNIYVVTEHEINGTRIDLQHYKDFEPYEFDRNNDVYKQEVRASNVIIQKILK